MKPMKPATAIAFAPALALSLAAGVAGANEMDANGDGVYSYTELVAAFAAMNEETFLAADTSGDGLVDADELAAAQEIGLIALSES